MASGLISAAISRLNRLAVAPDMPASHAADLIALRDAFAITQAQRPGSWLTQERKRILRRDWPAGVPFAEILPRLAACPGPPMPENPQRVRAAAQNLRLRRPPALLVEVARRAGRASAAQRTGKAQEARP